MYSVMGASGYTRMASIASLNIPKITRPVFRYREYVSIFLWVGGLSIGKTW